MKLSPSF